MHVLTSAPNVAVHDVHLSVVESTYSVEAHEPQELSGKRR